MFVTCLVYTAHCSSCVAHDCCVRYSNRTLTKHTGTLLQLCMITACHVFPCVCSYVTHVCHILLTAHYVLFIYVVCCSSFAMCCSRLCHVLFTIFYIHCSLLIKCCSCFLCIAHRLLCVTHVCSILLTAHYV